MPVLIELKDDRSENVHYDSPDYPIYIRRDLLSHYPNHTAPSHWHDDIELIAVLSGEMKYNVNGEILHLQSGQGIFVNARQMHFGFSHICSECDFICILLHPMLLCAASSFEDDFVLPVIQDDTMPYIFLNPDTRWKKEILDQIRSMHAHKNLKTSPLHVQSSFFYIWSLLCENISLDEKTANPQNSDLTITKNMVGFIQKNYARKVSLAAIAASGSVGQSKCCKLFKKYFGQTPNGYLNQYRLNKSTELLRDTDMPVTEIALSVGLGGASYYAEIFRKWLGKSPTEFRNHFRSYESAQYLRQTDRS